MTFMSSMFSSYSVYYGQDKVRIADGSLSQVASTGSIPVTSSLSLSSVFHVSNFQLNIVSISHLTKSLNCNVIFSLLLCF